MKNFKPAIKYLSGAFRKGASWFLFMAVFIGVTAVNSPADVASTKHNLGNMSTAAVYSPATTEICVFCHTPHNASPSGPLWNRQDSGATYNVYESQSLAATLSPNSPALGQPTGSSKLCLSCHDGTIAIGAVLNIPGGQAHSGTFTVTGPNIDASGRLTGSSAAYIGTELRDDHPISFSYSLSYPSNTEIIANTSLPPQMKLESGNVQCITCHDPHGTANPKFLVTPVENGALCTACHNKRYWSTNPSVHSTSTATWNGTGVNPWHMDMGAAGYADDTVALQSCLACHRSHGGAVKQELLKGTNPTTGALSGSRWTCLNCHNGNVTKNLTTEFNYLSSHLYTSEINSKFGRHTPSRGLAGDPAREAAASLGIANRHAECNDCHNAHGATAGNHTQGGATGNIIGGSLLGGWGVMPAPWGAAGAASLTYTVADFTTLVPGSNNLEGYLCLKCHSYYAFGTTPPQVPSGNANGSLVNDSDLTADFNPGNMGFHPAFALGKNQPPVTANPNWPLNNLGLSNTFAYMDFPGIGTRTGFYNVTHTSTITCTDCHSSNLPTDPRGAHGSSNKWLLRNNETGYGTLQNFCYNCHRRSVYGDEGYLPPNANQSRVPHPVDGLGLTSPFYTPGTNTGNNGNKFGILCLTCHGGGYDSVANVMKGIHGSNAAAGPLAGSDPVGYRMMNGACVQSYVRATTTTGAHMEFRTVTMSTGISTDPVCSNNFSNFTGNTATYNCTTISSCIN